MILTEFILAGGVSLGTAAALVLAESIKVALWPNTALFQTHLRQPKYAGGADPVRDCSGLANRSDQSLNERLLVSERAHTPTVASQLSGLDLHDIFVLIAFMFAMTAEYSIIARGELARAWADLPLMDRLPMLVSLIEQLRHWIAVMNLLIGAGWLR